MGPIVSAYSGLVQLDDPRVTATGEPLDTFCVRLDTAPRFPHYAADLDMQRVYRHRNAFSFSPGTDLMHDAFRERLAAIANYPAVPLAGARICHTNGAILEAFGPFKELIDFSITGGTIGTRVCAKLADDFACFFGCADAEEDHLFAELYRNWYFAFCLAENDGAVQIS